MADRDLIAAILTAGMLPTLEIPQSRSQRRGGPVTRAEAEALQRAIDHAFGLYRLVLNGLGVDPSGFAAEPGVQPLAAAPMAPDGANGQLVHDAPRITICGIPELGEHSAVGVTHVLSILGPNSPDPPEFAEFAPHRRLILRFHDVIEPQPDQIAPTREDVERLLAFGREVCDTPEAHLLVHCRAGLSRSTAAAALILMQANPEWPASAALDAIAAIRPRAWPNLLILEFGDALLGRNGEIVAAAGAIYRRILARDPKFVDQMIDAGRDREVSAAYRETG